MSDDHRPAIHLNDIAHVIKGIDLIADLDRSPRLQHDTGGEILGDATERQGENDSDHDHRREKWLNRNADYGQGDSEPDEEDDIASGAGAEVTQLVGETLEPCQQLAHCFRVMRERIQPTIATATARTAFQGSIVVVVRVSASTARTALIEDMVSRPR